MSEPTPVRVEAYAGASYPQRPTAVWIDARRLEVQNVIRQWRTPDALHFLVDIEDIHRTELIYRNENWFISF